MTLTEVPYSINRHGFQASTILHIAVLLAGHVVVGHGMVEWINGTAFSSVG